MKKFICFLILMSGMAGLVGCSTNDVPSARLYLHGMTIMESEVSEDRDFGIELLSFEEVSELAVDYISELLNRRFNGMYMQLTRSYNPYFSQHIWEVVVAYSEIDFDVQNEILWVEIDAVTGEVMFFLNLSVEPLYGINDLMMDVMSEVELLELFPEPNEIEIAEMREVVREYAQRHFSNSNILTLEYGFYTAGGIPDVTYYPSQNSPFFAIDDQARVVTIVIQRETKHLLIIITER